MTWPQYQQWVWRGLRRQVCLGLLLMGIGMTPYRSSAPVAWAAQQSIGCGGETIAAQNADFEARVVELVNEERAARNLPPLKLVAPLTDAARYHAADMAIDNYFDHSTQDRKQEELVTVCSWVERLRTYYNGIAIGENIAVGYRTPEQVMAGWMNSTGHRKNILGNFAEIGVGFYNNRWVQDFGTRTDVLAVVINRETRETDSPQIAIYVHGNGSELRLRNEKENWSAWQPFQNEIVWTLPERVGEHRVDIEVRRDQTIITGSDTIIVRDGSAPTPLPTSTPTATPRATPTLVPTSTLIPTGTPGAPQEFVNHTYLPLVLR